MKTYHLLFLTIFLAIGCQKDEPSATTGTGGTNTGGLSTVPATFTQKVLLECFTGAGQPQCPDGFVKMESILAANSTKAIPVNVQFSDAMEIAQYTSLSNAFSNGNLMTFPSARSNGRSSLNLAILNRTQWQSNFDVAKTKTAKCGLAIETSVNGSMLTINTHCGFNQNMSGDYTVSTYLLENNISGSGAMYDQRNAYNATSGHPYQGQGDPIAGFSHNNVLRKVLTAPLGDNISSSALVSGGKEIKTYTTSINGYKLNDLYVVAFITKTGTTPTNFEILNVQKVKAGNTQLLD